MKLNRLRLIAFFLLGILFIFPSLKADTQILEPVKWNFSSQKISDIEYELLFSTTIDYKWHLYSQDIPMSPPATTFHFNKNDKIELIGKVTENTSAVIEEYDPNIEMKLKFYATEILKASTSGKRSLA